MSPARAVSRTVSVVAYVVLCVVSSVGGTELGVHLDQGPQPRVVNSMCLGGTVVEGVDEGYPNGQLLAVDTRKPCTPRRPVAVGPARVEVPR